MGGRIKAVHLEIQPYGLWACFMWKSEPSRISLKEMKKSVVLLFPLFVSALPVFPFLEIVDLQHFS